MAASAEPQLGFVYSRYLARKERLCSVNSRATIFAVLDRTVPRTFHKY